MTGCATAHASVSLHSSPTLALTTASHVGAAPGRSCIASLHKKIFRRVGVFGSSYGLVAPLGQAAQAAQQHSGRARRGGREPLGRRIWRRWPRLIQRLPKPRLVGLCHLHSGRKIQGTGTRSANRATPIPRLGGQIFHQQRTLAAHLPPATRGIRAAYAASRKQPRGLRRVAELFVQHGVQIEAAVVAAVAVVAGAALGATEGWRAAVGRHVEPGDTKQRRCWELARRTEATDGAAASRRRAVGRWAGSWTGPCLAVGVDADADAGAGVSVGRRAHRRPPQAIEAIEARAGPDRTGQDRTEQDQRVHPQASRRRQMAAMARRGWAAGGRGGVMGGDGAAVGVGGRWRALAVGGHGRCQLPGGGHVAEGGGSQPA